MNRPGFSRCLRPAFMIALLATGLVAGCGETPSTSSSEEKATIKGIVTFEGKPVTKGTITFDPSNVNRRMAPTSTATIGPDGSYSLTSLVGRNTVSFDLPGLGTVQNRLNYSRINHEVTPGENSFNAELPVK